MRSISLLRAAGEPPFASLNDATPSGWFCWILKLDRFLNQTTLSSRLVLKINLTINVYPLK